MNDLTVRERLLYQCIKMAINASSRHLHTYLYSIMQLEQSAKPQSLVNTRNDTCACTYVVLNVLIHRYQNYCERNLHVCQDMAHEQTKYLARWKSSMSNIDFELLNDLERAWVGTKQSKQYDLAVEKLRVIFS